MAGARWGPEYDKYLKNKEASTALCSVEKYLESVERSRIVGENMKPYYLFYDKKSNDFPAHWAKCSNETLFSKEVKVVSGHGVLCSLIKHVKID